MVLSSCLSSVGCQGFLKLGQVFFDCFVPLIEVWKGLSGILNSATQGSHLSHELSLLSSKLQDFRVLADSTLVRIGKIGQC